MVKKPREPPHALLRRGIDPADISSLPIVGWSTEEVCQWVKATVPPNVYKANVERFRANNITGSSMIELDPMLLVQIGVVSEEDRSFLWRSALELRLGYDRQVFTMIESNYVLRNNTVNNIVKR